ncbi:hypothetical protein ABZ388_06715 [Micromonospora parva]|uniref:hypothetical protein n=1 Tax=Micromonospora parva TaxID=1464048 RepID=UPI0033BFD888
MADPLWINASSGAPAYSANELRQAMALALYYDNRLMGARQGVRPGGGQLGVSVAGSTITVQPGVACVDPGLSTPQGPYWVAIPTAETHTLAAADATNPRKDIVILRVYDHDEDSSGLRLARTEYLVGTPSPTPAEPGNEGGMPLATLSVPQVGGGSTVVTPTAPLTVASGGILPVRAASDIAAGARGRYRDRLDTNVLERDSGTGWATIADPAVFTAWTAYTPVWSTTGTAPSLGTGGAITGRYKQVGKDVTATGRILLGTTPSAGTGQWRITLPVAAQSGSLHVGSAVAFDATDATASRPVAAWLADASTMRFTAATGGDLSGGTVPFTWASSDQLRWSIRYEAA